MVGYWGVRWSGRWYKAIETNAQCIWQAWVPAAPPEMTNPGMNLPESHLSLRGGALSILVFSDVSHSKGQPTRLEAFTQGSRGCSLYLYHCGPILVF